MPKKRRSNGEGSVYQLKNGTWRGELQIDLDPLTGVPKKKFYRGKTEKEILEKIKEDKKKLDIGIKISSKTPTYGKWLDTWYEEYHVRAVSERTSSDNHYRIEKYIKPHLGKKKLPELCTHDIQTFINYLHQNGKISKENEGLSYNSIRLIMVVVRESLSQAVINRLIAFNPAIGVKMPKKEKGKKDEDKYLTFEEELEFIKNCSNFHHGLAAHFCLKTGLRRGELLGLRWSDLDFENNIMRIDQALSRINTPEGKTKIELGDLKTESSYRIVPIPKELLPALAKHRSKQKVQRIKCGPLWEDNDLVFCANNGRPVQITRFYKTVVTIGERAGIEKKVHPHMLRHTFSTRLLEQNVHPRFIQLLMGHSSMKMQEVYTHGTIQSLKEIMSQLQMAAAIKEKDLQKEGQ